MLALSLFCSSLGVSTFGNLYDLRVNCRELASWHVPPFHSTNEIPVWWPLVTSSLIKLTNLLSNISLSRFVANGKITWCERISALPARDHFLKEYHYPIQQLHLFTFIRIWKIFVGLSQVRPACYGIVLLYWYTCSYRPLRQICGSSLSCHTVHGGATLSDR